MLFFVIFRSLSRELTLQLDTIPCDKKQNTTQFLLQCTRGHCFESRVTHTHTKLQDRDGWTDKRPRVAEFCRIYQVLAPWRTVRGSTALPYLLRQTEQHSPIISRLGRGQEVNRYSDMRFGTHPDKRSANDRAFGSRYGSYVKDRRH